MNMTKLKKIENRYQIYKITRANPYVFKRDISAEIDLSRNSVSTYVKEMQEKQILVGPWLQLKPSTTHPRYVFLTTFSSPQKAFNRFKGFPGIISCFQCAGDWNLLFVTDRLIDFSQLTGHSRTHYYERRGSTWDLLAQPTTWNESLSECDTWFENPQKVEIPKEEPVRIPWTQNEWKLYWKFRNHLRLIIDSALKEISVSYEDFSVWRKSLEQYSRILTCYYPQGFWTYEAFFFLLKTDQPEYVASLFQNLPVTTLITQLGEELLLFLTLPRGEFLLRALTLFDGLADENFISSYEFAVLLQPWRREHDHI